MYNRLRSSAPPFITGTCRKLTTVSTIPPNAAAISQVFTLTSHVSNHLKRFPFRVPSSSNGVQSSHAAASSTHFEGLLAKFRTNAQDDGFFKSNTQPESPQTLAMTLSSKAIVVAIDTGGHCPTCVSDIGFCIYDKLRNSVYMIQIDINGRKLSRKSGIMTNLLAIPLKLDENQTMEFASKLLWYYLVEQRRAGHDVCMVGHSLERDLKSLRALGINVPRHVPKIDTDVLCRETMFQQGLNLRKLALSLGITELKPFHPSVNDAYYTLHVLLRLVNTPQFTKVPFQKLQAQHRKYMLRLDRKLVKETQKGWISQLKSEDPAKTAYELSRQERQFVKRFGLSFDPDPTLGNSSAAYGTVFISDEAGRSDGKFATMVSS
ncbi:CYFA0S35e00606g1_1 [Cyberlindnera fabianii]|uniref:CYFA0S35e00606g1_1 n=1 Tax=Cyberlindnera fabianii TaxID=36022 RepID=A0A061BKT4_CYBFA|nr:CYFA0S35e00606g1_1 [Cyberlindnera fabianii]